MYVVHRDIYPLCQGTQKGVGITPTGALTTEDGDYLVTEPVVDYLVTEDSVGTMAGSLTITDIGADFKSCGVQVGNAIRNLTDGSSGNVTAVTEDTVTCTLTGGTDNIFDTGDVYAIYCTSEYNSKISKMSTDKRYGRKVVERKQLTRGLFPKDVDLDEYRKKVFGPRQPKLERM